MRDVTQTVDLRKAKVTLFESLSEFALECRRRVRQDADSKWSGDLRTAIAQTLDGDLGSVPESDALLKQFESIAPLTAKWRVIDDVIGAVPNVPAFLAGSPLAMRRRQKVVDDLAPLTIVADLTNSGGFNARQLRARGVAALALARMLATRRPLTFWVTVGLGGGPSGASFLMAPVDTAPLDLARAAHVLTSTGVVRAMGYGFLHAHWTANGHWPWSNIDFYRPRGAKLFGEVLGTEVLFLPPLYLVDKRASDPAGWLNDMLKQYGGDLLDAA